MYTINEYNLGEISVHPTKVLFKGLFIRSNGTAGVICSEAFDNASTLERVYFDATFQSPYTREDITILKIKNSVTNETIFEHENFKDYNKDFADFGC